MKVQSLTCKSQKCHESILMLEFTQPSLAAIHAMHAYSYKFIWLQKGLSGLGLLSGYVLPARDFNAHKIYQRTTYKKFRLKKEKPENLELNNIKNYYLKKIKFFPNFSNLETSIFRFSSFVFSKVQKLNISIEYVFSLPDQIFFSGFKIIRFRPFSCQQHMHICVH